MMKQRFGVLLWVLALLGSACTGGTTTLTEGSLAGSGDPVTGDATPTAAQQPEPTAPVEDTPTSVPVEPTPVPTVAAATSWADDLEVGDCFDNTSTVEGEQEASPALDCQGEHEYEIFLIGNSDDPADAAFPTDPSYHDALFEDFCDPATIEFGGAPWDVVPFGVTVRMPSEAEWMTGDRTFACAAEAGLRDENKYKVGTAAGGTITTDEGIVARGTVGGQRDYFFSFQGSTLYPLTNGEYDISNTSPEALSIAFLFAAPLQNGDAVGAAAYSYDYDTGGVTQLETGLDGYEIASPHFAADLPAFVFAARETADDDWDIYLSRSAADVVALTDSETDDQWPTLTPDGSQVVYHSSDDIWIMNVDGTDKRQLTTDPGGDFESAVSPDGTSIVFASDRSGDDDIWMMNIDGSDQQNLTNHPGNEAWPFFSSDGSLVYFQTDRLGVSSNIMVMEADGSNPSYFSFEFMTNAALLPDDITTRFAAELPTISEALATADRGIVPGAEGERSEIAHSSDRLVATLPAGWEYQEIDGDVATLLVAPSIADFQDTWSADGALITVIESADLTAFTARIDAAFAADDSSCTLDGDSAETEGSRTTVRRRYNCGTASTAIVVGVYQADAALGLLFEGQWDSDPSSQQDEDLLTALGQALKWG